MEFEDIPDDDPGAKRVRLEDVLVLHEWMLEGLDGATNAVLEQQSAHSRGNKRKRGQDNEDTDSQQSSSTSAIDLTESPEESSASSSPGIAAIPEHQRKLYRNLTEDVYDPKKIAHTTRIMKILDVIMDAKRGEVLKQGRGIFYLDQALFGSQHNVSRIIEKLEHHWQERSIEFNIVAASRGLYAGPMRIVRRSQDDVAASQSQSSTSTQSSADSKSQSQSQPMQSQSPSEQDPWRHGELYRAQPIVPIDRRTVIAFDKPVSHVVVLEKDAVFSERVQELNKKYADAANTGNAAVPLLVTGVGMPATDTRSFIELLCQTLPDVPIYALTDGDVGGMHEVHIYKTPVEYSHFPDVDVDGRVEWKGLKPSQWRVQRLQPAQRQKRNGAERRVLGDVTNVASTQESQESQGSVASINSQNDSSDEGHVGLMPPRTSSAHGTGQGVCKPLTKNDYHKAFWLIRRVHKDMAIELGLLMQLGYKYQLEALRDVPLNDLLQM